MPPPLELEVVPDSAPRVELVSPATDTIVAGDDRSRCARRRRDDHGLARVEIVSWRQGVAGAAQPPTSQRLADASATVWDGSTGARPRAARPQAGRRAAREDRRDRQLAVGTARRESRAAAQDSDDGRAPRDRARVDGFGGQPGEARPRRPRSRFSSARATRRAIARSAAHRRIRRERQRRRQQEGHR